MSNPKRKREKANPLDTDIETIRQILNAFSKSPTLPDSPLKQVKLEEEQKTIHDERKIMKKDFYESPDSSAFSDEIEEGDYINETTNFSQEKPLIKLQEVKTMVNSSDSIMEENKKSFESADSDFKRINKMRSNESLFHNNLLTQDNLRNTGISPINLNTLNESITNLNSNLDISPNVYFPAFSKISEKSQEDMISMENVNFYDEKEKKYELPVKRKSEAYKQSNSVPLSNDPWNQWEKMLQKWNSSSRNCIDNSSSFQILRTLNSLNSQKSKISFEHWGHENITESENKVPVVLQNEILNHFKNSNENSVGENRKTEEKTSPMINSLRNLNLNGDSPLGLSPNAVKKTTFGGVNMSISMEFQKNDESLFSKKDSCSNFLNLEKPELAAELANSFLKQMEE